MKNKDKITKTTVVAIVLIAFIFFVILLIPGCLPNSGGGSSGGGSSGGGNTPGPGYPTETIKPCERCQPRWIAPEGGGYRVLIFDGGNENSEWECTGLCDDGVCSFANNYPHTDPFYKPTDCGCRSENTCHMEDAYCVGTCAEGGECAMQVYGCGCREPEQPSYDCNQLCLASVYKSPGECGYVPGGGGEQGMPCYSRSQIPIVYLDNAIGDQYCASISVEYPFCCCDFYPM
jgi:hypothetical protein